MEPASEPATEPATTKEKKAKAPKKKQDHPEGVDLRSFLEEDVRHLFDEKSFLTDCLLTQDTAALINKIYFDSEYPQNSVLRTQDGDIEVYQVGIKLGKWRQYTLDKVLEDLVNRVHHILNWHKIKHNKEIGRIADAQGYDYEGSVKWLDKLYDDESIREQTKQVIKDVLLHK
jgi:hypothetical protein